MGDIDKNRRVGYMGKNRKILHSGYGGGYIDECIGQYPLTCTLKKWMHCVLYN